MTTTVLFGPERRRRWTSAQKLRIVEESLAAGASAAVVARRHDVHPNLIHAWRRQVRSGELSVARADGVHFVPVAITPASGAPAVSVCSAGADVAIEVVLRNGRVLRVPGGDCAGTCGRPGGRAGRGWTMIPIPGGAQVWLATGHTDMRKGFGITVTVSALRGITVTVHLTRNN